MKKVFPSAEQTIHVWAQQLQEEGRCSNVFFENTKVLYSYGYHFPLAVFLDDNTVLINGSSYSVTTSKQQNYVRGAVRHKDIISAPTNIIKLVIDSADKKYIKRECAEYVNQVVSEKLKLAAKRRKKPVAQYDVNEAVTVYRNIEKLFEILKIKSLKNVVRVNIDELEADATSRIENVKVLLSKEKEADKRKTQKVIKIFKSGGVITSENQMLLRRLDTVYMRPVGEHEIHTTHGARFLIKEARKAFNLIGVVKESGEDQNFNLNKPMLGHFRIDTISSEGDVTAGCHYIKYDEIERNAKLLGWI